MHILNLQMLSDIELLEMAQKLSSKDGPIKEKLLHWDFGPLMTMKFDQNAQNYLFSKEAVPFHWDGAFHQVPKKLLFYCTESNGEGGESLFTNTTMIWNGLGRNKQEQCRKVWLTYKTQKVAHYGGEIRVPLVQKHPETGEVILRLAERVDSKLNPVELSIEGVSDPFGFYEDMKTLLYQDNYLTVHSWKRGDLLVVDNFTHLHGRRSLGNNLSRSFKRIQIL